MMYKCNSFCNNVDNNFPIYYYIEVLLYLQFDVINIM